jgi:hypothetical protein
MNCLHAVGLQKLSYLFKKATLSSFVHLLPMTVDYLLVHNILCTLSHGCNENFYNCVFISSLNFGITTSSGSGVDKCSTTRN